MMRINSPHEAVIETSTMHRLGNFIGHSDLVYDVVSKSIHAILYEILEQ